MSTIKYTRKDYARLKRTILEARRVCLAAHDIAAYERLLGFYAPFLTREVKEELLEDFRQDDANASGAIRRAGR